MPKFVASFAVMTLLSLATLAPGQSAHPAKSKWNAPLTSAGQPDLTGIWFSGTNTPLERPSDLAGREFFANEAEAEAWLKARNVRSAAATKADPVGSYNDVFWEPGSTVATGRTSMVIDPPDGRIPPLTPQARAAWDRKRKTMAARPNGPEDRTLRERCLVFPVAPPPMAPYIYNSNYQIFQTKDQVVIYTELNHDTRVIQLNAEHHLPSSIHLWLGDSIGHWEGNTLVVDTANLSANNEAWGADGNLHVIERFTRSEPGTIVYRWTLDNPTAFTKQWTGEYTMKAITDPIFEYACHEGNYALANILKGARAQDQAESKRQ